MIRTALATALALIAVLLALRWCPALTHALYGEPTCVVEAAYPPSY